MYALEISDCIFEKYQFYPLKQIMNARKQLALYDESLKFHNQNDFFNTFSTLVSKTYSGI